MPKVRLQVEVSEELLHRYEDVAKRQGNPVEQLLEQTVQVLLEDMEADEREPPDISSTIA